jgi:hypothetical protein
MGNRRNCKPQLRLNRFAAVRRAAPWRHAFPKTSFASCKGSV